MRVMMNTITYQMKNIIVIVTKNQIQTSIYININLYYNEYSYLRLLLYSMLKTIINRPLELEGVNCTLQSGSLVPSNSKGTRYEDCYKCA